MSKKISVAEYVAEFLYSKSIDTLFMITGGGAMFLNDALGNHPNINCIYNHHEQATAMAAEGYARIAKKPGVICVTTGPGGINALNGVFGAWVDSVPMIVISGQVKRETCMAYYPEIKMRQLGDQEADIIRMVQGITKNAIQIQDARFIRYELEKAWELCQQGRPGPCWIDIPIDIQSALVESQSLMGYQPTPAHPNKENEILYSEIMAQIQKAQSPVVLVGNGARQAKDAGLIDKLIERMNMPILTSWSGLDIWRSDDPRYIGRIGTIGTRAGNIVLQNADLVLVLGSRLNIRAVSYNWENFAKKALIIHADIDPGELEKPTNRAHIKINESCENFCRELIRRMESLDFHYRNERWLNWAKVIKDKYPAVTIEMKNRSSEKINPYIFFDALFDRMPDDAVIACGNGAACVIAVQTAKIKRQTRMILNSGCASMGYDIPAAIGAAIGRGDGKKVFCFAGDGSAQMNIQELQTIYHNQLNISIIIINNGGYSSIRQTQKNFFKRFTGESSDSGVSFPDYAKVAEAYKIPSMRVDINNMEEGIQFALSHEGPCLTEVIMDPEQGFEPKLSSRQTVEGTFISCSLEDMSPLLPDNELKENTYQK